MGKESLNVSQLLNKYGKHSGAAKSQVADCRGQQQDPGNECKLNATPWCMACSPCRTKVNAGQVLPVTT